MIEKGRSLKHLLDKRLDPESMANEYAMDVSATVYERMKELGLKKQDLAERLGVSASWVTKIIKGQQNITLKTIARLEDALDIDMAYGIRCPKKGIDADYELLIDSERSLRTKKAVKDFSPEIVMLAEVG